MYILLYLNRSDVNIGGLLNFKSKSKKLMKFNPIIVFQSVVFELAFIKRMVFGSFKVSCHNMPQFQSFDFLRESSGLLMSLSLSHNYKVIFKLVINTFAATNTKCLPTWKQILKILFWNQWAFRRNFFGKCSN